MQIRIQVQDDFDKSGNWMLKLMKIQLLDLPKYKCFLKRRQVPINAIPWDWYAASARGRVEARILASLSNWDLSIETKLMKIQLPDLPKYEYFLKSKQVPINAIPWPWAQCALAVCMYEARILASLSNWDLSIETELLRGQTVTSQHSAFAHSFHFPLLYDYHQNILYKQWNIECQL